MGTTSVNQIRTGSRLAFTEASAIAGNASALGVRRHDGFLPLSAGKVLMRGDFGCASKSRNWQKAWGICSAAKHECLRVESRYSLPQSRLPGVEWLDPQLTALKSSKERGVNRHESALRRIIEVDPIGRHRRIVAVALQIALRMLEGTSRSDPICDAQKQRSRIRR